MKATAFDLRQTYRGEWQLIAELAKDSVPEAMRLVDTFDHKPHELTVKPYREKRSLTANAYFHVLVNKLAAKLRIKDDACKVLMVRSYGTIAERNGIPAIITIPKGANPDDFYPYYEWLYGDANGDTYQLYKQTHQMNTEEFARLIDGTVQECKEMGIETLPPDELARLYAQADKGNKHTV